MSGRGLLAIGVLAAWGAGLAVFVQRETSRTPREKLAEAAARVAPGATYFAVEREGKHVGYASNTIDTIPGGLQVTDYVVGDLALGGVLQRVTAQSVVRLSRGLGLRDFAVAFGSDSVAIRATGHTVGDSLLEYVVERPGDRSDTTRVALSGPMFLPTLLPLPIALGDRPGVGRSYRMETFDPVSMTAGLLPLTIRAESLFVLVDSAAFDPNSARWLGAHADTVRGYRIVSDSANRFDAWVDALGRIISTRGPAGLTMRRTAYEVAFENWRKSSPLSAQRATRGASSRSVTGESAIAAGVMGDWTPIDSAWLRVEGVDLSQFAVDGDGQVVRADTVRLARMSAAKLRPQTLVLPLTPEMQARFGRELRAEPMLEIEDPSIARLATRIRRRDVMADLVTVRLMTWVHDSLMKEPTFTPPSAVAALRTRRGDSDEHAQLFVALARAAGIPARTVTGLIAIGGTYYYHAWAEVMLHQWVGVDPTLGQFPVDASHLRLLADGVGAHAEMSRVLDGVHVTPLRTSSVARRPSLDRSPR